MSVLFTVNAMKMENANAKLDGRIQTALKDNARINVQDMENVIVPLGIVLLTSTILYLIPRTAGLGAILLTGYLGGAVATHVHEKGTAFEILFPVVFGVLAWLGLYLRDRGVRAVVPLRS